MSCFMLTNIHFCTGCAILPSKMIWKCLLLSVGICLVFPGVGAGTLTGVTITGHEDGFIYVEDGTCTTCHATINVDYTPSTTGNILIKPPSQAALKNEDIPTGQHVYTFTTSELGGLGTHILNITVSQGGNTYEFGLVVIVETAVTGFVVEDAPSYVVPNEVFALGASVTAGTNVMFTIDFEKIIHMLKSCGSNLLDANITHTFSETGTYNLAIMVSNYVSKNTSYMQITVIYQLNGFTVTPPSTMVQTTEEVKLIINLDSGAQVSMGNVTIFLDCGGVTNSTELSSISPGGNQEKTCVFNIQGNYTVTLIIENGLGDITKIYHIYVWDILNVSLCMDNIYQGLDVTVPFYLTNLPSAGFQYKIDFGNGIIIENMTSDILFSSYSPINLPDVRYNQTGNFSVVFEAYNNMYAGVQHSTIIVIIAIKGLTVEWGKTAITVGTTYTVNVNITQGSSVIIAVNFDDGISMNDDCYYLHAEHTYNRSGHFRIDAIASNPAGNLSESLDIDVVYDLNGFTVGVNESLLETTKSANFYIYLDQTATVPMGNLTVTISPCGTSDLNESLIITLGETVNLQCSFTTQGNYSVTVTISSRLGTNKTYILDVYVWDILRLNVTVDKSDFFVSFQPVFQIINPPPSGFQYTLDFGENTNLSDTDSEILTKSYSDIALPTSFNYNVPGQYIVSFTAYNNFYMVFQDLCLNAQYGLPDSYLQVSPEASYVIPDHIAKFKIYAKSNSSVDKPTNVTCDIDYGDGDNVTNEPTEFDYDATGLGLTLTHNYTTPGTYTVTLKCSNLVSNISFTYTINVVKISTADFNISFSETNLLNETASGVFEVELQLYDLTIPPKNIKLEWNFADGSGAEIDDPMTSFVKQHTYTETGNYSVSLSITYDGTTRSEILNIRMGASTISLVTSTDYGLVSVTTFEFQVNNHLSGIPVSIEVIWGDGTTTTLSFTQNEAQKTETHQFTNAGALTPKIQATSSKGIEYSFLSNPIVIQNPIEDLTWTVSENVILLSGFSPEVEYTGNKFLINVTCVFNFNDGSKTSTNINFTTAAPVSSAPAFTYQTQGERTISANCSNIFTHQVLPEANIKVFSDCFNSGEMFDRSYKTKETALKAYMSSIPVISGRTQLSAKCGNSTKQAYQWSIEQYVSSQWTKLNVTSPNAKVYDLRMSHIGPGVYKLSCKLTITMENDESIDDYMYFELINPPLVVQLAWGSQRVIGKSALLSMDAITDSYDPVIGYGLENYLTFTWKCYVQDTDELDKYFIPNTKDISYTSGNTCAVNLISEGNVSVPASELNLLEKWIIFEVTISKDIRTAKAIQAIKVVKEPPPQITLTCKWNCELKKSRGARMVYNVGVTCSTCSAAEMASKTYVWTFYKYDLSTYKPLNNTDRHFLSAATDPAFELDADYMEQGTTYKLHVDITVGKRSPAFATTSFTVNEEPYNGTCFINPTEGTSTMDEFKFTCRRWKDEGSREKRDDTLDLSEPLTYVIIQHKGNESQIVYTGNEASSGHNLEVCPEEDNFVCRIEFRIQDLFKSESSVSVNVTVKSPIPNLPTVSFFGGGGGDSSDDNKTTEAKEAEKKAAEKQVTEFLSKTISSVDMLTDTKDSAKTVKVASAFMAAINTMKLPVVSADDIANAAAEGNNDALASALTQMTAPDEKTLEVQKATESITNAMLSSINSLVFDDPAEGSKGGDVPATTKPSSETLVMLTTSLATAMKEPNVVKPDVVANAAKGIESLSRVLLSTLNFSRDVNEVEGSIKAIGSGQSNLNKNLADVVVEENIEDIAGADVFVKRNLTEGEKMFNKIERKYMRKVADKKRQVKRQKMLKNIKETLSNFKTTTDNMFQLMDKVQEEGTMKKFEHGEFDLSLHKDSLLNIVKKERESSQGANFKLSGVEDNAIPHNESIKLHIKVMKKNIFIQGDNAKLINSPVVVASIKKSDGQSISIQRPVIKQTDPVSAPYQLVDPEFIPGDAAKMFYHSFFYRSLSSDVCMAAIPLHDVNVVYDLFFRALLPPTDMEYDHFVENQLGPGYSGTKICVRAGALKRTGVAFVGLRPRRNEATTTSRRKRSVSNPNATTSSLNTTSSPLNTTESPLNTTTSSPNTTTTSPTTGDGSDKSILESPYLFRLTTITCFNWDGDSQDWKSNECELKRDEDKNETTCECPNTGELVASVSFFVAPNAIDFTTVFSKFDIAGQAAVLSTLIIIFVLFVMAALYSRYKDGQDVLQWGVSLLEDNYSDDCYFYLITVYTGMIRHGGTKSKIEFNLSGEEGESGIRVLTDGVRKEFSSGSVLHFIMAVPLPLGHLQCLRVWHDNSGKGNWASWYLNRIEVIDLQTKERFDFLCYKWLSLEAGQVEKALGVGSTENLKNFKTMFFEHARHHVTDDHLWLSTVLRPVKSHFSRVQRVGCCFALVLLSMISNAMFFQGKDFKDRKQSYDLEFGPFKFNLSQIWISFVSAVITAIPVFVMMLLFRKSKLSKSQTSTEEFTSHWMLPCFKRFKFYKDSVALQKVLVIKDIVDDEEGVLPHACVYVGWVLVVLASLASSFFVMLYSMQWGKDISEEWLVTFFLSFFESMFILDPFKILFLAIIFAIILKNIKIVRPTVFDLKHIYLMNTKIGRPSEPRRHLDYKSLFSEAVMEEAKFKVEQKRKMHKAVSEFMVTVFLLILLCSICYSNRDPHGFLLRTTLSDQLFPPTQPLVKGGKPVIQIENVHRVREYFNWVNNTVMKAMFPQQNFNYEHLDATSRLMMSDLNNLRVGAPRLRLLRSKRTTCSLPYIGRVTCIPRYYVNSEDTGNYCQGWNQSKPCNEDEGLKLTSAAWTFVPASKIWGLPIQGGFNLYGGGGYIAELDISLPVAKQSLGELIDSMWIDRQARAVFLEFTVYCINLNMFAYISLLSEFPETGAVLYYTNIYTFRSLSLTGALGTYIRICEILFLITTVVWLVVIGVRLLKERWTFFQRFWNIAELATVCLSFAAVVLYFIRYRYTSEAIAKFKENNRIFVNFYHIAVWDNLFIMVVSILVAIVTVRLMKVMGNTKVTRTVFTVLKQSSKTLPGFFFYIILVLWAFALCGFVFFGTFAKEYKDVITCLESLFSAVLGHAGFTKMNIPMETNWFALMYFVVFIIFVVFTLANIFMTILLDTMAMLAEDHSADRDLELTTYLWYSAKEIITGRKEDGTLKSKYEMQNDQHLVRATFSELLKPDSKKPASVDQYWSD